MPNRKAITPVLAIVLLLMMTVATSSAAYFWMSSVQSNVQGQISTSATQSTVLTSSSINIISLQCGNGSPADINATIQNTGTIKVSNGTIAFTITDEDNKVLATNTSLDLRGNLLADQVRSFNFKASTSFTSNNAYGVKITLPGGIEQSSTCTAS